MSKVAKMEEQPHQFNTFQHLICFLLHEHGILSQIDLPPKPKKASLNVRIS